MVCMLISKLERYCIEVNAWRSYGPVNNEHCCHIPIYPTYHTKTARYMATYKGEHKTSTPP